MHASLQNEVEASGAPSSEAMQTLNLQLDEVAHIRSVLTKAELEGLPIDNNVRSDVERGRVSVDRFHLFYFEIENSQAQILLISLSL